MKAIVKLPLEAPLELRVLQIARMQLEVIGVYLYRRILEANDDLDGFALRACVESQQRMLVKTQLPQHSLQSGVSIGHVLIVSVRQPGHGGRLHMPMRALENGMRTRTVLAICVLLLMAMLLVAAQSSQEVESTALGTVRSINTAQATYMRTYIDSGYACEIQSLGPDPHGAGPSAMYANMLDRSITSGKEHNGYIFMLDCKVRTKPRREYRSSAVPAKKGTGRAFCSDQSGIIKYSIDGEAKTCFESGAALK